MDFLYDFFSNISCVILKEIYIMKRNALITLTILFIVKLCFSQDIITKLSGEDIQVKIIEERQYEIIYKRFNDPPQAIVKEMLNRYILMIRYENGAVSIYKDGKKVDITPLPNKDSIIMIYRGEADALRCYRGYRKAEFGTFLTSGLATPLVGLIPAISLSSSPPKDKYLNSPQKELMKNSNYYFAYKLKASEMKHKKVWYGWTFGIFVNICVLYMVLVSQGE